MKNGIGYAELESGYEVVNNNDRRMEPQAGQPGVYRSYSTAEEAEKAAKALAKAKKVAYIGEVR